MPTFKEKFWLPQIRGSRKIIATLILLALPFQLFAWPVSLFKGSRAGYSRNIRPLHCTSKAGEAGLCMFAWDCMKANGSHLDTCIDRFYFGSCCKLKGVGEPEDEELDELDEEIRQQIDSEDEIEINALAPVINTGTADNPLDTVVNILALDITQAEFDTNAPEHNNTAPHTKNNTLNSSNSTTEAQPVVDLSSGNSGLEVSNVTVSEDERQSSVSPEDSGAGNNSSVDSTNEDETNAPIIETTVAFTDSTNENRTHVGDEQTASLPEVIDENSIDVDLNNDKGTENVNIDITTVNSVNLEEQDNTKNSIVEQTTHTASEQQSIDTTVVSLNDSLEEISEPELPITTTNTIDIETPLISEVETDFTEVTENINTDVSENEYETVPEGDEEENITGNDSESQTTVISKKDEDLDTATVSAETQTEVAQIDTTGEVVAEETSVVDEGALDFGLTKVTEEVTDEVSTQSPITETETIDPIVEIDSNIELITTAPVESTTIEVSEPEVISTESQIIDQTTVANSWSEVDIITTTTDSPVPPTPGHNISEVVISFPAGSSSPNPPPESSTEVFIKPLLPGEHDKELVESLKIANYKDICGNPVYPTSRIVGGTDADYGEWPWQVSLRQWRSVAFLHKCGAALVNENWAITAAHCVEGIEPDQLLLVMGEYDLGSTKEPYGHVERSVQVIAMHPKFEPRTFEYDLALLRFSEPIVFQPNIIPICIPDEDYTFLNDTGFVTGWGRLYDDGPLPTVLQKVPVPVIPNEDCEKMYERAGYIEHIPHIFICAGYQSGKQDSCEGDSGGPMVINYKNRWRLAGIISWGIGCAVPNQPGVYTRISEFREWINKIIIF